MEWSGTICAILVGGLIRNNSVKIFLIWTSGSRDIVERYFLSRALVAPLISRIICAILVEGIIRKNSVKLFQIWTFGSVGDVV